MKLITIEEHYTNQKVIDANAKYAPKRQLTPEQQKIAEFLRTKIDNATSDEIEKLKSVRWYADCGDSGFFYEGNTEVFLAMKNRGILIDYRMRGGVNSSEKIRGGRLRKITYIDGRVAKME